MIPTDYMLKCEKWVESSINWCQQLCLVFSDIWFLTEQTLGNSGIEFQSFLLQKYLEYEDAQDQEKRNLQAGIESLEYQNRNNESKVKSYVDQRT